MNRFTEAFGTWTPRAVVFDCDGLLLDTESVWGRTQQAMLERYGATLTAELEAQMHGATLEVASQHIADVAGLAYEQVLAETKAQFEADLGADLVPMPGALAVVRATAAQVPIACASNSWHEALEDKLTRAGIIELFGRLESTDTVEHGKPAPDMYMQAARGLGVEPSEALAFEDSATGARAALSGGLRLVTVTDAGDAVPAGDLRLTSLDDPELLAWITTWGASGA